MSKTVMRSLKLDDILVGERFRKDYGDIDELADDILARGVLQPISVSSDMKLLAGGRRYAAAQKAGLKVIPALIRDVVDEIDAREVELVENVMRKDFTWQERNNLIKNIDELYKAKSGESWSGRKTAELIGKSSGGVNKALQIAEASQYMPELMDCKTEDEAFKTLKKAQEQAVVQMLREDQDKKLADITEEDEVESADYTLKLLKYGSSHYRVQDAFEGLAELKALQDEMGQKTKISLVEIDPPYGIDLDDQKKRTTEVDDDLERYTEVPRDKYVEFLDRLCKDVYEVTPNDVWVLFWFGPTWFTEVKGALLGAGFQVDDIPGIWAKPGGQTNAPDRYLARAYEPFFIAWKGDPLLKERGKRNVFDFAPVAAAKKYHPTQRPVELMETLLDTFCYPGSVILVPFLGSGVTLRAGYRLGMTGFGFDLDQNNKDRFLLKLEDDAAAIE